MRRSQRLIAATVAVALSSVLAGCWRRHEQFRSDRSARLPRHQEEAAGRAQAGVPRGRAGPRAGRAEGFVQGSATAADRPAERRGCGRRGSAAGGAEVEAASKSKGKRQSAGRCQQRPAAGPARRPIRCRAGSRRRRPAAVPPAPKPKKIARKRTTAPPPDQTAGSLRSRPRLRPAQQSAAPFPAPMPSGSFSR